MGLGTAKGFLLGVLSLVLIAVAMVIVLVQLDTTSTGLRDTYTTTNETEAFINASTYTVDNETGVQTNGFTVLAIVNWSDGNVSNLEVVELANITTIDSEGGTFNKSVLGKVYPNVSITYTFDKSSNAGLIVTNTTTASVDLFDNVGTWLTLLSVVIIILIIAGVIVVINRFDATSSRESL